MGNFESNIYTGMKWQCVEFARRYWLVRYNVILPNISWACYIFDLETVARVGDFALVPLSKYEDSVTKELPKEGDLLIYKSMPN